MVMRGAKTVTSILAYLCAWAFLALMLVAGLSKLLNLAAFRDSLDTWVLLPQPARAPIALFVPIAEVALVLLWVFYRYKWAYIVLGMLVVCFTILYGVHVIWVSPPDCNCTVKLAAFATWQDTVTGIFARNGMFLVLWGVGFIGVLRFTNAVAQGEPDAKTSSHSVHTA